MFQMMGKILFISATFSMFPYLHLIVHGMRIIFSYIILRLLYGKSCEDIFESATALTVSSTCYSPLRGKKQTDGLFSKMAKGYAGVPFIIFLDVLMYAFYMTFGLMTRNKTLQEYCRELNICSFAETKTIESQMFNNDPYYDLYRVTFHDYELLFLVYWILCVQTLYFT